LSGNGNTGALLEDTHFAAGKFGTALSFDGSDDVVIVDNPAGMLPHIGTVIVRYSPSASKVGGQLFSHRTAGVNNRIYVIDDSLNISIGIGNLGTVDTGVNSVIGKYNQIVLVWNNGTYAAYVDGIEKLSSTYTDFSTLSPRVSFGAYATILPAVAEYQGLIDYEMIFNKALTAQQIAQLYIDPFPWFRQEPIDLWTAATSVGAVPPSSIAILRRRRSA